MGEFRILWKLGDKILCWCEQAAGDPEAKEAVRQAVLIVNQEPSKGGMRATTGAEKMESFDPSAE